MATVNQSALESLRSLEQGVHDEFVANKRVLSFDEYFAEFTASPRLQSRSAPQYLLDCLEFYGHEEVQRPQGAASRFRLFDCPWEDDDDATARHRVVGHEEAAHEQWAVEQRAKPKRHKKEGPLMPCKACQARGW